MNGTCEHVKFLGVQFNPMFRVINIEKRYSEATPKNFIKIHPKELAKKIMQDKNGVAYGFTSTFEIIDSAGISPYFDIENVPNDKADELIKQIINDIIHLLREKTFVNVPRKMRSVLGDEGEKAYVAYVLTRNEGSLQHNGMSYHLIFPNLSTTQLNLRKLVKLLYRDHDEYKKYVDETVYSTNRLFRCPYQVGVANDGSGLYADSIHVIAGESTVLNKCGNVCIDTLIWSDCIGKSDYECEKFLARTTINGNSEKFTLHIQPRFMPDEREYINKELASGKRYGSSGDMKKNVLEQIVAATTAAIGAKKPAEKRVTDKDVYDRCIVLLEIIDSGVAYTKLKEYVDWYLAHDNSFNGFRLTPLQVNSAIDLIENKAKI